MSIGRVRTVLVHTWYHFTHSMETWVDIYWFSLVDVVIFGLISVFFAKETGGKEIAFIILGINFWEVIRVGEYATAVAALWEIWSKSFASLFVSPLTLEEFLLGQMISAILKMVVGFLFTALLSFVLFKFSIFSLGPILVVYLIELTIFSWGFGMVVLGLILRFGLEIQSLSWSLIFFLQPLAGIFYPVTVLPSVIRPITYVFPVTYTMEAARRHLTTGSIWTEYLVIAFILDLVYFVVGYWFLKRMFAFAKETGRFVRMEA